MEWVTQVYTFLINPTNIRHRKLVTHHSYNGTDSLVTPTTLGKDGIWVGDLAFCWSVPPKDRQPSEAIENQHAIKTFLIQKPRTVPAGFLGKQQPTKSSP